MSHEQILVIPAAVPSHESPAPPVEVDTVAFEVPATPTAEQVRTTDHVFARSDDADTIYNLLGMWTGAMILRDVAVDTFATADEEDEQNQCATRLDVAPA